MPLLGSIFQRDYVAKADEHYNKGEMHKAAEMYVKAERPEQAADVYVELGEKEKAVECYVGAGMPLRAAELLERLGEYRDAISYYEEADAYRQAGEASLKAKNPMRAGRFFEQASMFRKAAESFAAAGEHERSLAAWGREIERLKTGAEDEGSPALKHEIREIEMLRAEVLESLSRFGEAAEILARYGAAPRAGSLFVRDKRFAAAAAAFHEAGHTTQAFEAVEQADDAPDELRAEIYVRAGKDTEAGEIFERLGRLEEAAAAFEQGTAWSKAAELNEKLGYPDRAAELFLRVERFADAARCYDKSEEWAAAASSYSKAAHYAEAGEAYLKAKRPYEAGNAFLTVGMTDRAFGVLQEIPAEHPEYGMASLLLIPLLLEQDLIDGAEHRLEALKNDPREGRWFPSYKKWYWQGRIEEAKSHFRDAEVSYQKVLAEKRNFADASERLETMRSHLSGPMQEVVPETPPEPAEAPGVPTGPATLDATFQGTAPSGRPDLKGLPFVIKKDLDPWWNGVGVYEAIDRRRKAPVLLVAFPKVFVSFGPEQLRHSMGKYTGFGLGAVLTLHELVLAHEHVLLLYEPFPSEPLGQLLGLGPLQPLQALNVLQQICFALKEGHKVNITHQWISPRTILVDHEQRVKLVGLGLRDVLAKHDHTSRAYLSPETAEGQEGSPASDVFSVGLLGIELLQAFMPAGWNPENLDPDEVGWPSETEDAAPSSVRRMLLQCLRQDPLRRPSADDLHKGLASVGFVPGQLLGDRYEIKDELGRGGMSRVYRAHDRQFDEEVAIKTMINLAADSSEERDRLFREVQICRKISHPNVVRVHDFGQFPGGVFIIMELLDGPGLDEVIEKDAPLPLQEVQTLLQEIAAALGEAHRLNVVHRDLKPANVILVDQRVKVMDFGIAHLNDEKSKHLTRVGEVVGSPLYMSPEQIQGLPLDGTCDLYALGVIAYALLTGKEPFEAPTATAVVFKHLHESPPDLRELRPNIPNAWTAMLDKLLAKKPEDRYQSAKDLAPVLAKLPV